jgi:hypothetical protein
MPTRTNYTRCLLRPIAKHPSRYLQIPRRLPTHNKQVFVKDPDGTVYEARFNKLRKRLCCETMSMGKFEYPLSAEFFFDLPLGAKQFGVAPDPFPQITLPNKRHGTLRVFFQP